MHATRWMTAILALPLLFSWIALGGVFFFFILLLILAALAYGEYSRMLAKAFPSVLNPLFNLLVYLCLALLILSTFWGFPALFFTFASSLILLILWCVLRFDKEAFLVFSLPFEFMAILWIGLPLASIAMLRLMDQGITWIFFLLFLVGIGDTGAYYSGRFFGKRKLAPAVSPAKTLEGFFGGLISTMIIAFFFQIFFLSSFPLLSVLLIAFFASLAASLGDLFESMQKRFIGVKDSGNLLPGHGGILDRIDALLFAAPVLLTMRILLLGI